MHKIELHTTAEDLAEFAFLHDIGAEIIGGIAIEHYKNSAPVPGSRGGTPSPKSMNRANMKIEIFTSFLDDNLLQRLATTESVLDVRINSCAPLNLSESQAEPEKIHSGNDQPAAVHNSLATTCMVDSFTPGYLRLRVETDKSPYCLQVIFHTLLIHGIEIQNGRKFCQGDTDFITLTIPQTNEKVLRLLQSEITAGLTPTGHAAKTFTSGHVPGVIGLSLALRGSSSMPSITITAQGPAAAIRAAFHDTLYAFNCDISIGRITGSARKIEDIYYLRGLDRNPITHKHLNLLKQRITGESNAEN
ncbi:MAG: hypothetical protein VR65_12825 [Desulfobulbaceae bacterium BRH_c16a]|nr:MAG: hypothetical protein VR65_12825 [Desulfobulbaceae bacterium BRH_c16a]